MSQMICNGWSIRPRVLLVRNVVDWRNLCKIKDDEWAPYARVRRRICLTIMTVGTARAAVVTPIMMIGDESIRGERSSLPHCFKK